MHGCVAVILFNFSVGLRIFKIKNWGRNPGVTAHAEIRMLLLGCFEWGPHLPRADLIRNIYNVIQLGHLVLLSILCHCDLDFLQAGFGCSHQGKAWAYELLIFLWPVWVLIVWTPQNIILFRVFLLNVIREATVRVTFFHSLGHSMIYVNAKKVKTIVLSASWLSCPKTSASYFTHGGKVGSRHIPSYSPTPEVDQRGVALNHTPAWGRGGRWRAGVRVELI